MPIYEYACAACGHKFEEWQKMSDPPVRTCPKCKKKKVEKLISQTAFQLKGGGWYSDLYASSKPSSKSAGGDSGGAKESSGSKDSASSESSSSSSKSDSGGAESKSSAKDTKKTTPKKAESRAA